jgi:3-deoxy-7-phosphoheptulonate synthase
MLIVMKHTASPAQIEHVISEIQRRGYRAESIPGRERTAIGLIGDDGRIDAHVLAALPGVVRIIHVSQPFRQVSRETRPEDTVFDLPHGVLVGGRNVVVIAGPCAVESEEQILAAAKEVRSAGASVLRGGAFKPRTSPYAFQGLGEKGLILLAAAGRKYGMPVVTEAVDPAGVELVARHADIIQIGARNMQNYSVLREAGRAGKPIILKRGLSATVKELLLAAEYIFLEGETRIILCERGIRTFASHARNTLDLTAVATVHELSHLPIIVDPSHATGSRSKVIPMARAAVAAGADGVMLEAHPDPERALSDGAQSLRTEQLPQLIDELRTIAQAIGRDLEPRRASESPSGVQSVAGPA